MGNDEREDLNAHPAPDAHEGNPHNPSPDEESVASDLLHALGFKKKRRLSEDSSASQGTPSSESEERLSSEEAAPSEAPIRLEDLFGAEYPAHETADAKTQEEQTHWGDGGGAEPPSSSDQLVEATPAPQRPKAKKIALAIATAALVIVGAIYNLPSFMEPSPPSEDVVASYSGKYVTTEELQRFVAQEKVKENEHAYCEKHGYDHSKCTPDEACESHPIDSLEGYRQLVTRLATEQIIQEWASSQGITQREDVQHGLKDLLENASVSQLMDQLHEEEITPESISSWEVQQYYNENMASYSGKSLAEVEAEIRQILVSRKDEDFFENYIEELKKTAGLKVNLDILRVTEPTDEEITNYYVQNASEFLTAETARGLEIRITMDGAERSAAEAIRKIRSGESFESVAAAYGEGGVAGELEVEKGFGEDAMESALWKMKPGDISDPIANSDGSFSIVKLTGITQAGTRPLSEVKSDIRSVLLQENQEREYALRKGEALFTVHSRRYTLGEFYTEFQELSTEYQTQFATYEQKQELVQQLIAKELLLEETGDDSATEDEHSLEELKIQYLGQILHQQDVDGKLTDPTEEEMQTFYSENKASFTVPASARISLIWIDQGPNGEKAEQARQKAEEALSQIKGGADFAQTARNYSEDGSASSGGLVDGMLDRNYLPEELATVIFELETGETSGIVDYSYGYFIFKVHERTDERQMTFEESAETIKEHLKEIKHHELESEMGQNLLTSANLTIYDKTLQKLLEQQNG